MIYQTYRNLAQHYSFATALFLPTAVIGALVAVCLHPASVPAADDVGRTGPAPAFGDFAFLLPAPILQGLQDPDRCRGTASGLPVDSPPQRMHKTPFHHLINQAAEAHGIDPALVMAVIRAESNFDPEAVSHRGAQGLMQLMPATAAELGVEDAFDPEDNINAGVKYLRELLNRFDDDLRLALAAYNAGSRYVHRYRGVPPFRATRQFIDKVFLYRARFEAGTSPDVPAKI